MNVLFGTIHSATDYKDYGEGKTFNKTHWAFPAVDKMTQAGVFLGYPDEKFHGDDPLNRYQAAAMMYALMRSVEQNKLPMVSRASFEAMEARVQVLESRLDHIA